MNRRGITFLFFFVLVLFFLFITAYFTLVLKPVQQQTSVDDLGRLAFAVFELDTKLQVQHFFIEQSAELSAYKTLEFLFSQCGYACISGISCDVSKDSFKQQFLSFFKKEFSDYLKHVEKSEEDYTLSLDLQDTQLVLLFVLNKPIQAGTLGVDYTLGHTFTVTVPFSYPSLERVTSSLFSPTFQGCSSLNPAYPSCTYEKEVLTLPSYYSSLYGSYNYICTYLQPVVPLINPLFEKLPAVATPVD